MVPWGMKILERPSKKSVMAKTMIAMGPPFGVSMPAGNVEISATKFAMARIMIAMARPMKACSTPVALVGRTRRVLRWLGQ